MDLDDPQFADPAHGALSLGDGRTVVAQLTAPRPAALATLAVRGPHATHVVLRQVTLSARELQPGRIYFGSWKLPGQELVEHVVVCRTAVDEVEVHCHGGHAVTAALMQCMQSAGCRVVSADALSSPACPLKRAARDDLLLSTTDRAAAILLDQLQGALSQRIDRIANEIADQEHSAAAGLLAETLQWSELGLHLTQAWRVVLAGPPNVGKSSLANALVGSQRTIVHSQPGTTRDWLELETAIDGWPVTITDTAGFRAPSDAIEQQGIEFAHEQVNRADLVILVVDGQIGWTETHERLLELPVRRRICVWNKCDLKRPSDFQGAWQRSSASCPARNPIGLARSGNGAMGKLIETSCSLGLGIAHLIDEVSAALVDRQPPAGAAVPFRQEQVEQLRQAHDLLRGGQPTQAMHCLQSLRWTWIGSGKGP